MAQAHPLFRKAPLLTAACAAVLALSACSTVWDSSGRHSGNNSDFNFGYQQIRGQSTSPSAKNKSAQSSNGNKSGAQTQTASSGTQAVQPENGPAQQTAPSKQPVVASSKSAPAPGGVLAEAAPQPQSSQSQVLPRFKGISLQRYGDIHWLAVQAPADWVWNHCRHFLDQAGLSVAKSDPKTGFMETHWASRAPNVPLSLLNKLFQTRTITARKVTYRFRLRLERDPDHPGVIDVYLTQQRAKQVMSSETGGYGKHGGPVWQPAEKDAHVEAMMLQRLMVSLGESAKGAQQSLNNTRQTRPAMRVGQTGNGNAYLSLQASFANAWRAAQSALDRTGAEVHAQPQQAKFLVKTSDGKRFTVALKKQGHGTRLRVEPDSRGNAQAALSLAQHLRAALS